MKRLKSVFKAFVTLLAIANIAAMIIFEYKLPSFASLAETGEDYSAETVVQKDQNKAVDVGTIEAVEKEKSSMESEAADIALAKGEVSLEKADEERDPEAPFLELTDDHINLKIGERFNYMSYIKTMEDVDGSDLSRYIHLDRDVNTWELGEIELTYRITSAITGKSSSKVLLITIEE